MGKGKTPNNGLVEAYLIRELENKTTFKTLQNDILLVQSAGV